MARYDIHHRSRLRDLLQEAVDNRMIPGAVAIAGTHRDIEHVVAVGSALVDGGSPHPMQEDTIFDLASLTKVIGTLPLILQLAQDGQLALQDQVVDYLPEFTGEAKDAVTIAQLLTHTAGLVSHREYFRTIKGYSAILRAAMAEPLENQPNTQVVYSDLGYMMLGEIVQRVTGQPLEEVVARRVLDRLNMTDAGYCPTQPERIAATEIFDGMAKVGMVHDDNTEAMGGVSGHAGLFASGYDVARYVSEWASDDGDFLSQAVMDKSVQLHTADCGGRRGWGWVLRGDSHDGLGDFWPDSSAGHTGFTGTSAAFDRRSHRWAVLLTNRVHYGREISIVKLRRRFYNHIMTGER